MSHENPTQSHAESVRVHQRHVEEGIKVSGCAHCFPLARSAEPNTNASRTKRTDSFLRAKDFIESETAEPPRKDGKEFLPGKPDEVKKEPPIPHIGRGGKTFT